MADANVTAVQKLYISYFSRPADAAGLAYWANALAANQNALAAMSTEFSVSKEYNDMYAGMDNRARVVEIYENLFTRTADSAGVDYWTNLLNTSQVSFANAVTAIAGGAQGDDRFVFNGKVAAATVFTERLDLPAEKAAYSGAAANKIAFDWIGTIRDIQTAAAANDPGVVDGVIARIVGTPSAMDDVAIM